MPKKKLVNLNSEQTALCGFSYVNKKEQVSQLNKEIKELRVPLEQYMDANEKEISGGSKVYILPHADMEVVLKRTLRSSAELLPNATDILRENGLTDCLESVVIVREDRLQAMYEAGKVPDEIMKKVYASKDSYAFSVSLQKKPSIPEV